MSNLEIECQQSAARCFDVAPKSVRFPPIAHRASGMHASSDANESDERHIPGGVVHDLPDDLKDELARDSAALATWNDITPLARNEWICWVESVKKAETRTKRIDWGLENLRAGQRRPCCWPGCPHRGAGLKIEA